MMRNTSISCWNGHAPLWLVVWTLWSALPQSVQAQQAVALFKLPGDRIQWAFVVAPDATLPDDASILTPDMPRMIQQQHGILAVVRGRDLKALVSSEPRVRESVELPASAALRFTIKLVGQKTSKSISIYHTSDGTFFGEYDPPRGDAEDPFGGFRCVELNAVRFQTVAADWSHFAGPFESIEQPARATAIQLEQPYTPGLLYMDQRELKARTFVAEPGETFGTTRDLESETLHARVSAKYDPKTPAGLLVWVHAIPSGTPPTVFHEACDELNLICIGADHCGNDRPVADRYQLALDAVATARTRYHIDPRRVYVTGISGGGRISSMLWATAPEVFTGAIPIVGINYYKAIPTGDGRFWPATYRQPPAKLLNLMKPHRVAAMTGPPDFNYAPTVATINLMKRDGWDAKLFEYEDMAHQMPTPVRFLEALRWIDEPYQRTRERETAEARKWLDRFQQRYGSGESIDDTAREMLRRAIEAGPWTEPAWEAWRLLEPEFPDRQ